MDYPTTDIDAAQDICPAGWRMPTGGKIAGTSIDFGEYADLYEEYKPSLSNFRAAFRLPMSGVYDQNNTIYYNGSEGYLWTSTYNNGTASSVLRARYDSTASIIFGSGRAFLIPVRCILK